MATNKETDLSKVTQCLIHTECSVMLIGSQGLRKLNKYPKPQVEGLSGKLLDGLHNNI